jgi:hypothetical protein
MLSRWKTVLWALMRKSQAERELGEELRHHIEQQTEQNIRLGMNPEEARYAALKAFGGVEQAKERSRHARGVRWLEELWQDLSYGRRKQNLPPGEWLNFIKRRDLVDWRRRSRSVVAAGNYKLPALYAALNGRLFNVLITDELAAKALLDAASSRR